jgi:hypothetical protein
VLFHEIAETARGHIARMLARGQELGEVRGDRTADELARSLQQSIWGTLVLWSITGDAVDVRQRLALTLEVFRHGVAGQPPRETSREKLS